MKFVKTVVLLLIASVVASMIGCAPPVARETSLTAEATDGVNPVGATCAHAFHDIQIINYINTGSDDTHTVSVKQQCWYCGAIRYTTYPQWHNYVRTWYCYYKYNSSYHHLKEGFVCSKCGHYHETILNHAHTWAGNYCTLCGQTR